MLISFNFHKPETFSIGQHQSTNTIKSPSWRMPESFARVPFAFCSVYKTLFPSLDVFSLVQRWCLMCFHKYSHEGLKRQKEKSNRFALAPYITVSHLRTLKSHQNCEIAVNWKTLSRSTLWDVDGRRVCYALRSSPINTYKKKVVDGDATNAKKH